jgi:transposase-like protein
MSMSNTERQIQRKLRVLKYAEQIGSVAKTCRYFGVARASFYRWKAAYDRSGEPGLVNRKTGIAASQKNPTDNAAIIKTASNQCSVTSSG